MARGNKRLTKKQAAIQWRREKCGELWMSGFTFTQMADYLKVSPATITQDFVTIRADAQARLNNIIDRELPTSWLKARMAIQFVQRETLRIFHKATTDNGKLAALQAFSLAQKEEFELVSNSDVLDKCLQHVFSENNRVVEKETEEEDDPELRSESSEYTQDTRAE